MNTVELLNLLKANENTPKNIFGSAIESTYRKYAVICHPDTHPNDKYALETFKLLGQLKAKLDTPDVTIQSKSRTYAVGSLYASGDISDVYSATANGHPYLIKMVRESKHNALLAKDVTALKGFSKLGRETPYFPSIVESFAVKGKSVLVMPYEPGFYTLRQVKDKYPDGVEPKHFAWMFKRLIAAVGYTHQQGLVHGHITPEHFLIHAVNHGGRLIDWTMHLKPGEKITSISAKYKGWYPPEVLSKKPVSFASDVYMAAKCGIWLLGETQLIPSEIRGFLKVCVMGSTNPRPDNAWALHKDFDGILKKVFGEPKYHQFVME